MGYSPVVDILRNKSLIQTKNCRKIYYKNSQVMIFLPFIKAWEKYLMTNCELRKDNEKLWIIKKKFKYEFLFIEIFLYN